MSPKRGNSKSQTTPARAYLREREPVLLSSEAFVMPEGAQSEDVQQDLRRQTRNRAERIALRPKRRDVLEQARHLRVLLRNGRIHRVKIRQCGEIPQVDWVLEVADNSNGRGQCKADTNRAAYLERTS